MSILWTRLGRFGQLILAHVLFMLVAFSGGGLVSNGRVRRAQVKTLDLSLFVLPGACALSAVIVLCLHGWGGSARSYCWYALPLIMAVLYFAYFQSLVRQVRRGH
jgi:TRAP-type C4-dicarboxylate transport system permease small subunit